MRSKIHMLLFSVLATLGSSLAMADTQVNVKTETVRYDDIRLISAVGAAVLYGRLQTAAVRACNGPIEAVPLAQKGRYKACVEDSVAKAVAEVNEPMLTWYYDSKRGVPTTQGNESAVAKTP